MNKAYDTRWRVNKAYNMRVFTRLPGKLAPVHPAVGLIEDNSPVSRANNIYSPSNYKWTEVQWCMSASCQPGSRVILAFSDVENYILFQFSDLLNTKGAHTYTIILF